MPIYQIVSFLERKKIDFRLEFLVDETLSFEIICEFFTITENKYIILKNPYRVEQGKLRCKCLSVFPSTVGSVVTNNAIPFVPHALKVLLS